MNKNSKDCGDLEENGAGHRKSSLNGHAEDGEKRTTANSPGGSDPRRKHKFSVSHSGRYKNKKRERSQILNREELWDGKSPSKNTSTPASAPTSSSSSSSAYSRTVGANKNSPVTYNATASYGPQPPSYKYRDVQPQIANVNRIMPRSPPTAAV